MIAVLRSALIITRRDYVATVWSRAFILFLIGPLFPIIFGLMFGAIGSRMQTTTPAPVIAVIATPVQAASISDARATLVGVFGVDAVPRLRIVTPHANQIAQREHLLADVRISAVLSGLPDAPALYGPEQAIDQYAAVAELLVVDMRSRAAMERVKIVRTPMKLVRTAEQQAKTSDFQDRITLARGAQLVLLVLTMVLAGMLLSNMMEEKSSKVIEILAAAVPIDAIFIGKLIAMLGMSLTGIAIWSILALGGMQMIGPGAAQLAVPAVGWPMFVILGVLYFMASYLLLGALFLGIGAQASTVREVQTLSMPVSMGQLVIFALAAATVEQPDSAAAAAAMIFPWSSPFAMLARAAERPELWPHLIALAWQMLAVALIIRIGARLFRRSVLKSGGPGFWRQLIGHSSSAR